MTEQARGWMALADVLDSARRLERMVMEGAESFTRDELRTGTDQLADDLTCWLEALNRDAADQRATTGPMLSRDGLTQIRGWFLARWRDRGGTP